MTGEGQRSLRTAGLLATSFCIALLWTIAAFTSAVPFPPTALAEAVIRAMPGDAATYFIELLGPWAHRLLTIGAVAGALLLGGEVGVRTATDRPRTLVAGS
ncbi:MAG TPA: hypothetical protein VFS18_02650, partial [Actinomycetota bacterium]|nr:hypothetical protein [Actinomycetota bacterium]